MGCFAVLKEKQITDSSTGTVSDAYLAPTEIVRLSPTSLRDPVVRIRVSGLQSGDTLHVFKNDSSCTSTVWTSVSVTGSAVNVTLPALSVGSHQIYVQRSNNSETSSCSLVWLDIIVNQTMDSPLISAITSTTITAASIQFSNLVVGDTVQLYSNSDCTTAIGSSFTASSVNQTITMDSNTTGIYGNITFYGKVSYSSATQTSISSSCGATGLSYNFNYPPPTQIQRNASLNAHESRFNLTVSGPAASDVVKVFSDVNCTVQIGTATVGSGQTTVAMATTVSLAEGSFELHATRENISGNISPCSTAKLDVVVDLTLNVPTVTAVTPTTAISFLATIGNLEVNTTIEIHRNNTCSQLVTSMAVVEGNTSQSVHNVGLSNGSYEIYARLKYSRSYGDLYSACSSTHQSYNQTGNYLSTSFVGKWDTTLNTWLSTNQIKLPIDNGTYQIFVHWGDGQVSIFNNITPWTYPGESSNSTHDYSSGGIYNVEISGQFDSFQLFETYNHAGFKDVLQWGSNQFKNINFAKYKSAGFSATDTPNTSQVTSFHDLFKSANLFNGDISGWDTSSVTDMTYAFEFASAFNQPLSTWDTSNVTSMSGMFLGASAFNQNINNWDVSKVTDMANMFGATSAFNQPLNNWTTTSLTYFAGIFAAATAFNQNINSWNVSQVSAFGSVFEGATAFNQPLNNWNVASAANMSAMFRNASAFNQNINTWNVANVQSMAGMFTGAAQFNQPLNNWNTSNVADMTQMFRNATNFNQDISMWIVNPKVTYCNSFRVSSAMTLPPNFSFCNPNNF